jgi:hypothetical protein
VVGLLSTRAMCPNVALFSQIPFTEIAFVLVQAACWFVGISTFLKIRKKTKAQSFWRELGGTQARPDELHQRYMRDDPAYRRRFREFTVLLVLAGICLIAAFTLNSTVESTVPPQATQKLVLYLGCCGAGLEWWATGIAAMLMMRKFTETVEALFILSFAFAALIAAMFSVLIALRISQVA